MLKSAGKNTNGDSFWTLHVPAEYANLEIGVVINSDGIWFGNDCLSWGQVDKARQDLSA